MSESKNPSQTTAADTAQKTKNSKNADKACRMPHEGEILTGSQIFIQSLINEGVTDIFGYPGGSVIGLYEQLYHTKEITHYLVRHEQAAIHAAEGYARVSGKAGVALVTSGPGACNAITGIANAYYDGYPLVVFTGQVGSKLIGNDAFQEADIVGITRSCCKHNYLVKDVKDLARTIKEAFHIATTGKPGPVVVDMPKDMLDAKTPFYYPQSVDLPGYNPTYKGHHKQILAALKLLAGASKPLIIAGGGVIASKAESELRELADLMNIPVVSTLMGIGAYEGDHDKKLGLIGMHGSYWSNYAVHNADVILAVGTRFNDRVTGNLKYFAKNAKIIHIDIDPCSISKNVPVHIPIVGDAKNVLDVMNNELKHTDFKINQKPRCEWIELIADWKSKKTLKRVKSDKLSPIAVIQKVYQLIDAKDPIVTTEVGQHQMWAAQLFRRAKTRKFITSGGLGTMGFGFPAAVGAQIAKPDDLVFVIAGDGSIQMNIQELATCVYYNIPVKVLIINNGYLGMVRQWQEQLYDKHYSQTEISGPDFVKLAEAYGAMGIRIEKEQEIEPAIEKALNHNGPVFIDARVDAFETVYPWVLAGQPLSNMLLPANMKDKGE